MSATGDRIADPWGARTPYGSGGRWPQRVDLELEEGLAERDVDAWFRSASLLHSNGDAHELAVRDGRIVGIRGLAGDRVNRGRLDPKDCYGWQATGSPDRLTHPLMRDGDRLVACDWDSALERIVERTRALLARPGGNERIGFYTSGQLMLEEYYTLAVIGTAGIGTPHMDGNTRLCTATAAAALKESFGSDGQPASYEDVDHCDALALFGHNVAEVQTVLWMRMLDRLEGPDRPALLCVDPRETPVARAADVHLAPRLGTNVALMNALLAQLLRHGWIDGGWVARHTHGFEALARTVEPWTPERAATVCDVPARAIEAAAELVGSCERLLSTVLQGFYQSNQVTAAACQVNNLHLLRGMIGRAGAGVLQMARSDLEIFLDYARRLDLRDRDGMPLIGWDDPEAAFAAWADCSRGRPCDYSDLSYARLREQGGTQWGGARLYGDGRFLTDPEEAETYGHDLRDGRPYSAAEARARDAGGRALLRAADYVPPPEEPDAAHPLQLTTGRTLWHFHTRTTTARAPRLDAAAPEVWAQLSDADAAALGVAPGDRVRIVSARGAIEAPARVGGVRRGVVFVPFHHGWWDLPADDADPPPHRTANELTMTELDPVSKQPMFKLAAVRVERL